MLPPPTTTATDDDEFQRAFRSEITTPLDPFEKPGTAYFVCRLKVSRVKGRSMKALLDLI